MSSAFGLKLKLSGIYAYSLTLSGFFLVMENVTETYIYAPPLAILILFILSVADMILGLSVAVSQKEGIEPRKLSRAMLRFFTQCFFTAMAFQLSIALPAYISSYMVDFLVMVFTITVFASGYKNAWLLKLITDDQYAVFESLFNVKKLINMFKKSKPHE
tara:strand:- start:25443 stop:25922 length:480 start_codon:yes stop_codon:yes gene_type:complete